MDPIERNLLRHERTVLLDRKNKAQAIRAEFKRCGNWRAAELVRTAIANIEYDLEINLRRRVGAQLPAHARGSHGLERATVRR